MKSKKMLLGVALIALGFTSCKDEKETQAEKTVDMYVVYVDSLGKVADAKTNWQAIDAGYQMKTSEAEAALANLKNKEKAQEKVDASKAKFDDLKAKVEADMEAEKQATDAANPKQKLRNNLFGEGKVGDDMNFSWVNKDNILKVYETFFQSYKDNKSNFSREDYDEVKLMYEALDSRKNTVEKEGLSSSDNGEIAEIKFKFAPMFKVNRIGAKSREMEKAKE
ncbi:hypothetical protein FNW52_05950 [Flavobacterium sp. ZT3R18]|uniref:hypothetical protein n=1 Tax=Flavobacterium sp. ZT3R18 TaxID=2594429 RepID=UPI001179AF91|nr:hypothetical protein [Flavobacterium sp. ZT3R18]TRX36780.1 hypothetical protein FNW52_05950 [Flavobacterium sp. ZT3R18]